MYQHLLRFLNQILLHNYTNLIQLIFWFYYDHKVENDSSLYSNIFFININIKSNIINLLLGLQFTIFSLLILNSFWFVFFRNSFLQNGPTVSSPLRSLIKYVLRTIFLTFLTTKSFSKEFRT